MKKGNEESVSWQENFVGTDITRDLTANIIGTKGNGATIEVPLYLEGREIARASAWYVGEQLAWEER